MEDIPCTKCEGTMRREILSPEKKAPVSFFIWFLLIFLWGFVIADLYVLIWVGEKIRLSGLGLAILFGAILSVLVWDRITDDHRGFIGRRYIWRCQKCGCVLYHS